jgi:hypothetical protein
MTWLYAVTWVALAGALWLGGVIWGRNAERRRWLERPLGWNEIPKRRWP